MNDITKEQLQKLEKIGLVIADSISNDYDLLNESYLNDKRRINDLYSVFSDAIGHINEVKIKK